MLEETLPVIRLVCPLTTAQELARLRWISWKCGSVTKALRMGREAHWIWGHDFFELLTTATSDRLGALVTGLR